MRTIEIPWEAAFQNDRYADLAIAAKSFVSEEIQEEAYLRYYFGDSLNEYKKARYYLMQQVCHMYYAMLMLKFNEIPELIKNKKLSLSSYEGRLLYGKVLINEALRNMKKTRFSESVQTVQDGSDS